MRMHRGGIGWLVILAACARPVVTPAAGPGPASGQSGTTAAAITAADVKTRISFLASDALKGRDTPSPGLETAAAYIAGEFRRFGLQPAGDSGGYLRRYSYTTSRRTAPPMLSLETAGAGVPLKYGSDFFIAPGPLALTEGTLSFMGTLTPQTTMPADAAGKIIAYYMPGAEPSQEWIGGVSGLIRAAMQSPATAPKAVVLLLDPAFTNDGVAMVAANAGGEELPLALIGVRYAFARDWFGKGGVNLDTQRSSPGAALNGLRISLRNEMQKIESRPPNVVAILTGSDPVLKDTYVIYSAHMDHVGVGQPNSKGDSIFNGADDDASGTSAVIEVAQAFAALPQRPKRSIIFLTVSGEEKGLLGSKAFVEAPSVPLEKIVADINIDMIGRNNPDTVVAIGQDYSSLGPLAQQINSQNADLKLKVAPDLWPEEGLFFRSDHFSFAVKNVPAIFFTTGLHPDYHQPSDEPATIDNDKVARIARLVFRLGEAIANSATVPQWTEKGKAAIKAAQQ